MANSGPHSNNSQFYITLRPLPCLDNSRVAFGCVVDGFGVLNAMNKLETQNERPITRVKITDCGVFTPNK